MGAQQTRSDPLSQLVQLGALGASWTRCCPQRSLWANSGVTKNELSAITREAAALDAMSYGEHWRLSVTAQRPVCWDG
jgi:hypothetical protein